MMRLQLSIKHIKDFKINPLSIREYQKAAAIVLILNIDRIH